MDLDENQQIQELDGQLGQFLLNEYFWREIWAVDHNFNIYDKGCGSKSVDFQRTARFCRYTDLFPHPLAIKHHVATISPY